MTPIEKNVIVVDELGNEYEATYPKRAKGLVKNGRARFIDENKICLIEPCPPPYITEDIKMAENAKIINIPADNENEIPAIISNTSGKLTAENVFEKLSELQNTMTDDNNSMVHLKCTITDLLEERSINMNDSEAFDSNTTTMLVSITGAFKEREESFRKLIELYEGLLDSLTVNQESKVETIARLGQGLNHDNYDDDVWEIIIRALNRELEGEFDED